MAVWGESAHPVQRVVSSGVHGDADRRYCYVSYQITLINSIFSFAKQILYLTIHVYEQLPNSNGCLESFDYHTLPLVTLYRRSKLDLR